MRLLSVCCHKQAYAVQEPSASTQATALTVLQVHRMLLPYAPPAEGQNYGFFGQLQA
jgi:hypothetical protein